MRVYYIFHINSYFSYMYSKSPYKLYKMLEEMIKSKEKDVILSYRYFEQLAIPLKKNEFNNKITNKYKDNEYYHKRERSHIICSTNEYSKLTIYNAFLLIKSEINYPCFFNDIEEKNIFICDFNNKDYFWLSNIKKDCRQNEYVV